MSTWEGGSKGEKESHSRTTHQTLKFLSEHVLGKKSILVVSSKLLRRVGLSTLSLCFFTSQIHQPWNDSCQSQKRSTIVKYGGHFSVLSKWIFLKHLVVLLLTFYSSTYMTSPPLVLLIPSSSSFGGFFTVSLNCQCVQISVLSHCSHSTLEANLHCQCRDPKCNCLPRGVQPFGISELHWKKSCLGPHIKYTNTKKNKKNLITF